MVICDDPWPKWPTEKMTLEFLTMWLIMINVAVIQYSELPANFSYVFTTNISLNHARSTATNGSRSGSQAVTRYPCDLSELDDAFNYLLAVNSVQYLDRYIWNIFIVVLAVCWHWRSERYAHTGHCLSFRGRGPVTETALFRCLDCLSTRSPVNRHRRSLSGIHWIHLFLRWHVCVYVCMSENLYSARLKQKVTSRRGLKQTETSSVPVWTVQRICSYPVMVMFSLIAEFQRLITSWTKRFCGSW